MFNLIYCILLIVSFPIIFIKFIFQSTFRRGCIDKFTFKNWNSPHLNVNNGCIWFHAASVGEVKLAIECIEKIKAQIQHSIILTTNTFSGLELAQKKNIPSLIAPFDFSYLIRKFLQKFNICGLVLIETEIWPNMIQLSKKKGFVIIVNARLSNKSFPLYKKIKFILIPVLNQIDQILVGDWNSKNRFLELGVSQEKIQFMGNMKFSFLNTINPKDQQVQKQTYQINASNFIWVCGSIQPEELPFILHVYDNINDKINNLCLFIIPRHIEKKIQFERYLSKYQNAKNLFFLPEIGILNTWYSLADCIFVGGSLCRRGGQNMIEAIAYKKPVCIGPYATNFFQEVAILEANGGIQIVSSEIEMEEFVVTCQSNSKWSSKLAKRGYKTIQLHSGALEKTIKYLLKYINTKN